MGEAGSFGIYITYVNFYCIFIIRKQLHNSDIRLFTQLFGALYATIDWK